MADLAKGSGLICKGGICQNLGDRIVWMVGDDTKGLVYIIYNTGHVKFRSILRIMYFKHFADGSMYDLV